jgi:SAM-dependent methyltransferase
LSNDIRVTVRSFNTRDERGSGRYWDRIAASHPEHGASQVLRLYSDAVYVPLLERWLPEDAGCALKTDLFDEAWSDGLVPVLAGRARSVIGTDLSVLVRRHARRRHTALHAVGADVRSLPFADRVFDTVVSNSTLDHFPTRRELNDGLREIHRVLRPGGQLIVTLDNLANPTIALRNALPFTLWRRLGLVPYFVGASYRPSQLRAALDALGFTVTNVATVMHVPRLLVRMMGAVLHESRQPGLVAALARFEWLGRAPSRSLTGQFVAAKALRGE